MIKQTTAKKTTSDAIQILEKDVIAVVTCSFAIE